MTPVARSEVAAIPRAEVDARRADMEARGMTTWLVGWTQVAAWAGAAGFEGWLAARGYDPRTCEAVHVEELIAEEAMLLGAYRRGGDA